MTITEIRDLQQGSEEWLAARRGMVTASVVGQLITPGTIKVARNDYSRALTLTLAAERITGWTEDVWVTADMQRGNDDEPRARDYYSEHFAPVTQAGFIVATIGDSTIGYSPDGLVGDHGLIEVKSRKPKKHLATIVADTVPAENMAQIQCGLLVSGRQWCDYISWCGGMHPYVKRVTPDERWFTAIREAVEAFEIAAEEITATYYNRVGGLPITERIIEQEITF